MILMSCPTSDKVTADAARLIMCAIGLAVGVVFILSLPELKRYIKISTM